MNDNAVRLDPHEASVIQDAQARIEARRRAWLREKALLDRTGSDWSLARLEGDQE